jgi:hypothetical protein
MWNKHQKILYSKLNFFSDHSDQKQEWLGGRGGGGGADMLYFSCPVQPVWVWKNRATKNEWTIEVCEGATLLPSVCVAPDYATQWGKKVGLRARQLFKMAERLQD